jgi:hypothetical protein
MAIVGAASGKEKGNGELSQELHCSMELAFGQRREIRVERKMTPLDELQVPP